MGVVEWVVVAIVVLGLVAAAFRWDRYRGNRKAAPGASRSKPTGEVFVDPESGRRTRVWYDPSTGEREYRAD